MDPSTNDEYIHISTDGISERRHELVCGLGDEADRECSSNDSKQRNANVPRIGVLAMSEAVTCVDCSQVLTICDPVFVSEGAGQTGMIPDFDAVSVFAFCAVVQKKSSLLHTPSFTCP
ncbi:unnamed protein product [Toxocara canis]|uniref:Uncharacterized protein n=1 Tax=Toxocara canis TaxID=6265 RepID=A0A183VEC9_TOXCA|nr:unnamed protein product [Toxocara canis]